MERVSTLVLVLSVGSVATSPPSVTKRRVKGRCADTTVFSSKVLGGLKRAKYGHFTNNNNNNFFLFSPWRDGRKSGAAETIHPSLVHLFLEFYQKLVISPQKSAKNKYFFTDPVS